MGTTSELRIFFYTAEMEYQFRHERDRANKSDSLGQIHANIMDIKIFWGLYHSYPRLTNERP